MTQTIKSMSITEATLVSRSFRSLKDNPSIDVCCEVPILGRTVDLAYIENRLIFTIEFKLGDWRKGLVQARDHLLGADYAYICMPRRRVSDEMRSELEEVGVGLVFYRENRGWPFEEVIKASRSRETWEVCRSWVLEYIDKNKGKGS